MADESWDSVEFIDTSVPTANPNLVTFYYPQTPEETRKAGLSYGMEGGVQGGAGFSDIDLRNHTLEKFKAGESPFVAVAMKGKPTGDEFALDLHGEQVWAKQVDTGGGLRVGQIDVATSNPQLAKTGTIRPTGRKVDLVQANDLSQTITPIQTLTTRRATPVHPEDAPKFNWDNVIEPLEIPTLKKQVVTDDVPSLEPQVIAPEENYAGQEAITVPGWPRSGTQMDQAAIREAAPFIEHVEGTPLVAAQPMTIDPADPGYEKAGKAVFNTLEGFASGLTSLSGVTGLLAPFYGIGKMTEAIPALIPKLAEADKTKAGSPERYQAVADTLGVLAGPATFGLLDEPSKGINQYPMGLPKSIDELIATRVQHPWDNVAIRDRGEIVPVPRGAAKGAQAAFVDAAREKRADILADPNFEQWFAPPEQGHFWVGTSAELGIEPQKARTPSSKGDFIDVPFVRMDEGTVGDRVSAMLTPEEGMRPARAILLQPNEQTPLPLAGYPVILHGNGTRTVFRPKESEQDQFPNEIEFLDENEMFPTEVVPQQPGTVRLYHGSSYGLPQAGRDFTTNLQYASDYAAKAVGEGNGQVWYVDVPEGTLKTHDEYGQPMTRVVVPDEIANQARPFEASTEVPTPEDLALSTMDAPAFESYLKDLERQSQQDDALIATGETGQRGFGSDISPIAAAIIGMGGIKPGSLKGGKLATPGHNAMIYKEGGQPADVVATLLDEAGLIDDAYTETLATALKGESAQAHNLFKKGKAKQPELPIPSQAQVAHDFEQLGVSDDERMVIAGQHYLAFDPVSGEVREIFPTRDEAMDYLQNDGSPGETIVARRPGQPDKLVAKLPDNVFTLEQQEVAKATKKLGRAPTTGKDWDEVFSLETPETDAQRVAREKAEAQGNQAVQTLAEKKAKVKYGWEQRKIGTTGSLGQTELGGVEGAAPELFSQKTRTPLEEYRLQEKQEELNRPLSPAEENALVKLERAEGSLSKKGKAQLKKLRLRKKGEAGAMGLGYLQPTAEAIKRMRARAAFRDYTLAKEGAVRGLSTVYANERANVIRQDFGLVKDAKKRGTRAYRDLEALTAIEESGRNKTKLRDHRNLVATSKSTAMRDKWLPKYDYALREFDRINAIPDKFRDEMNRQISWEAYRGVDMGYTPDYVPHLFAEAPKGFMFGGMFKVGGSALPRWFTKHRSFNSLAEAIHEGENPRAMNAADLAEGRIRAGKRLILGKDFIKALERHPMPDGKVALSAKDVRGYTPIDVYGTKVWAHPDAANFLDVLFDSSAIRKSTAGRVALGVAGVQKQVQLAADTFHAVRLSAYLAGAGKGVTRLPRSGYRRGIAVLELSPEQYAKAISSGEYSPAEVRYARENRPLMIELLGQGAEVGKWQDNLSQQMHSLVPGTKRLNSFIFDSLGRGALTTALLENFKRNLKAFPEWSREKAARKTVLEMNEMFGNPGRKIFTNKTFQDIMQMLMLAPNWVLTQVKNEGRAYAQMAGYPINVIQGLAKGQGMRSFTRLGATAKSRLSLAAGLFVLGQVLNMALNKGKNTFDNDEGHKLHTKIPKGTMGVSKDYYFDPAQIPFEFTHQIMKYLRKGEGPLGTAAHIIDNKLSKLARTVRGGYQYATIGKVQTYRGGPTADTGPEAARLLAEEMLPLPIFSGGVMEPEPRSNWLFRGTRKPDAAMLQAAASAGVKLEPEETARQKMYVKARPFMRAEDQAQPMVGKYSELKHALENRDKESVAREVSLIMKEAPNRAARVKMFDNIHKSLGIGKEGTLPTYFTHSKEAEAKFKRSLAPEDRSLYREAQQEHVQMVRFYRIMEPQLKRQLISAP